MKCYHCGNHSDKYDMIEIDLDGPVPGCSEFANDVADVPICHTCAYTDLFLNYGETTDAN